jgi:hypothetical protein
MRELAWALMRSSRHHLRRFVANVNSDHTDESRAFIMTNWPAKLKQ